MLASGHSDNVFYKITEDLMLEYIWKQQQQMKRSSRCPLKTIQHWRQTSTPNQSVRNQIMPLQTMNAKKCVLHLEWNSLSKITTIPKWEEQKGRVVSVLFDCFAIRTYREIIWKQTKLLGSCWGKKHSRIQSTELINYNALAHFPHAFINASKKQAAFFIILQSTKVE